MSTVTQPNPLAEGLHDYRLTDPSIMVIFGATGDLSSKKLLPAIYNLAKQRLLPAGFAVMGAAIDDMSDDAFRKRAAEAITQHSRTQPIDQTVLQAFLSEAFYQKVDFSKRDDFKALQRRLDELDSSRHTGGNRVYYCATPPPTYETIIEQLKATAMTTGPGFHRIVVEKPFGFDLKSARELNKIVQRVFHEDSVFRIDHYLGKETVQNILAFRFANTIFEPVWNSNLIDSVQITAAEELAIPQGTLTETFAALRLFVDNWRWAGVPFYIRAGKRLPKRATEIRVAFKKPPHLTFGRDAAAELETNAITLRIQPEEGISLRFGAKVPSAGVKLRSVTMDFDYASSFLVETPEAYERLLLDCMIGDPTLFTRADEVEAAWALIDPMEAAWRDGRPPLQFYDAGTWGPAAAGKLLEADGREWHRP